MSSIDMLVAGIRAAAEQLRAVGASLASSRATAEELKDQFAVLGAGDKADQLEQIEQDITEQQAAAAAAETQTEAVQARAETLRGTGGSGGRGAPPGPSPSEPPRHDPSMVIPREGMAGIRPYSEAGTAEGNLFFASGKQNDRPLKATPGETKFRPGEVKPAWQHTKPAQGHIEGNVAADMLHAEERKAVLFLNAEPCDHDGNGCKTNTAHYLKPGSELMVKVCDDQGRLRLRKKITGTGEALTGE